MTEDYRELVEELNRTKHQVSVLEINVQKKIAVAMWEYFREHLDELYDMLTADEISWHDVDYGYDAVDKIKEDFCEEFEKDTGLTVDWDNHCILCHNISATSRCDMCPLGSCAAHTDNPYHRLVEYAFHRESRNSALKAIDIIIKAIKGAEL